MPVVTNCLQESDSFLLAAKRTPVDLEAWAVSMMERQNRRSHLAPQLSPETKALLRDGGTAPSSASYDKTPTTAAPREVNGASATPSRPTYPTRTSSASQVPQHNVMSLPIRPAPPGGPLPQVPRRFGP